MFTWNQSPASKITAKDLYACGGEQNYGNYCNRKVAKLLQQTALTLDEAPVGEHDPHTPRPSACIPGSHPSREVMPPTRAEWHNAILAVATVVIADELQGVGAARIVLDHLLELVALVLDPAAEADREGLPDLLVARARGVELAQDRERGLEVPEREQDAVEAAPERGVGRERGHDADAPNSAARPRYRLDLRDEVELVDGAEDAMIARARLSLIRYS